MLERGADKDNVSFDGLNPLVMAVKKGYKKILERLLQIGCIVIHQVTSLNNNTALHIATENGDLAIVDMLIQAGADYTIENKNKELPVDLAIKSGNSKIEEYLKRLI